MATNNYEINYDDERFGQVDSDKQQALTELEQTYGGMINESDKYYQAQIDASKQWAEQQQQIQQDQTDFTIEQIEQQKDKAHKDYLKEQSGAYVDWQKQSNQYGAAAEQQAAAGMAGSGFSESSQVGMYNAYQNRVMTAREVFAQATLAYDNNIKEARLQNNAAMAEIALQAYIQQTELALQGFQYKNNLVLEQANKKVELDNTYYGRYLDVLNQINRENEQAEAIRQYEQNYALSIKQYEESVRQFNADYELKKKEYQEGIRQFNEEIARLKAKDKKEYELEIKNLELKKKQLEQDQKQWEAEQALKKQQLAEEKRQFDAQMAAKKSSGSSGGGGGSSSVKKSSGTKSTVTKSSNTASASKSSAPTNNMASILALGYGPISASKLASLMASGQVKRTLKNGQYYYSKNTASTSYNRLKNMGLSY
jgi:hypothetical protein